MIFGLKLLGNLALAYGALKMEENEGSSVLFPFLVDLIFIVIFSAFGIILGEQRFPFGGMLAFIWSLVFVLLSYLHFFIVMLIGSKLQRKDNGQ